MKLDLVCNIPVPVTFNCWKHHAKYLITSAKILNRRNIPDQELKKILLQIGSSQMDIYLGDISPQIIGEEIIDELKNYGLYFIEDYKSWLSGNGKDFRLIELSDGSIWTLRLGNEPERYVHIHPGRYSPHTVRVKASTLKTTIAVMIKLKCRDVKELDVNFINNIRKNFLGIAPLKTVSFSSGLGKFIALLACLKQ